MARNGRKKERIVPGAKKQERGIWNMKYGKQKIFHHYRIMEDAEIREDLIHRGKETDLMGGLGHRAKRLLLKGMEKNPGIDGILVTVGLCIIALLLCVVMKDSLQSFIETIVTAMTTEAQKILTGVSG